MPVDLWRVSVAGLPLAFLLVAFLWWRWHGVTAGLVALAGTVALAVTFFGIPLLSIAVALWRAVVLSLDVLYIIWAALVLYQVAELTGAIRGIGYAVARFTEDHVLQLLIIGFAFSSFLQGIEGFGVPVAVTAPLLLGLGFRPLDAAAVPLVGHAWAVSFGTLASSFIALRGVTGLPARDMARWIAVFLGLAAVATGFAVMHIHADWRPVRRAFGATLALGAAMGGIQLLLVWTDNWTIAAAVAGMVGLAAGIQLARLTHHLGPALGGLLPEWPPPQGRREPPRVLAPDPSPMSFHLAFLPYYLLIVIVALATFVVPVRAALGAVRFTFFSPATATVPGWTTPPARAVLAPFGHPGALILYAAGLSAVWFTRAGRTLSWSALWKNTVRQGLPTTATILAMMGVAMLMVYSGMTYALAAGLSRVAGRAFPLLAPFIGALGTVITGSNTNSNVLFGVLQRDSARLLGMDPVLMAALQSAGGALGSMVAPAKVVLATATTGLAGQEGMIMRVTGRYLLAMVLGLGLIGWIWTIR